MLPDTAASSTSRPDTENTAYAISQPLHDCLRGTISRLDEQKAQLTEAKTIVQRIHLKLPQVENSGALPTNYRESIVSAWKSATESYVRIFEQLCELTGPDPASGREAEGSYVGFQKLLYTAEAARTVAFEQDEQITRARREAESSSESESDAPKIHTSNKEAKQAPAEIASVKRAAVLEHSPSQDASRPLKKQRTAAIGDVDMEADRTANTPTNQATEPSAITTVQRLKPKQIRKARKQRIQQHREQQEQQQAGSRPPAVDETQQQQGSSNTTNVHPNAQYEDVSVELEKRLRIKEEQKKAKKEAKKRKRDSQGSHILEAEPGAEKEAVEVRAKALAQKPAKKRSKSENGEGVRADEKSVPHKGSAKEKRGTDEGEHAEGAGARRSKRNKTH